MMRLSRNPKLMFTPEDSATENLRRHGRLRCESTSSCIGEVMDLSASGMRVMRRGRPILDVGDEFVITIRHENDGNVMKLPARVVWIKRAGFRKIMYGLQFSDLNEEQRTHLTTLARIVTDQSVFRCA